MGDSYSNEPRAKPLALSVMATSKRRLLSPGPTQVPESARLALAREITHHRTPEFRQLFADALDGLREVFQTSHDVIVLACSGTGAMEAAVTNVVPRGGKAIVLDAGRFAERWSEICEAFEIQVVRHRVPWGDAVDPADVARLLAEHPDAAAVFGTLMESSTGVVHDIQAIGAVVRNSPALFVVDGISGAGAIECRTDAWGIDVLVVGSQKALMLPPGLGFLAVSPRAWRQIDTFRPQAFYFDLKRFRDKLGPAPDTPWTPAHTLIAALAETLREIRAEGIENVWKRNSRLARAFRAGIAALKLEVFARRPADGMTAFAIPPSIDTGKLLKRLEERFGIKLASGQGPLKGRIARIAHFGLVDELDILSTLAALELALAELGWPIELGSGVAAASREFA